MKNAPVLYISVALTLCLTSLSARSDSVDFSFEGTVTWVSIIEPFGVKVGDPVLVTGTFDNVFTSSGLESVSFGSGSGNTLEIFVGSAIFAETNDDHYTGGGSPTLEFSEGSLVLFNYRSTDGPGFESDDSGSGNTFFSVDFIDGIWDYDLSFKMSPVDNDDDDDLCPDTAMGDAVDAVGCSDAQVDRDGDGMCDPNAASGGPGMCTGDDYCPDNTQVPEDVVPTVRLNPNHWALTGDGDPYEFGTLVKGKGKGLNRSYTIEDTHGCSCEQIIYMQGLGDGHTKFGCSISAMDDWVELVNP